ncbi:MAG: DUF4062 domain-containing protein [Mogibacterium sp.]|nr:DUF4062 domain-containing protein [Mogibacterium sp.]
MKSIFVSSTFRDMQYERDMLQTIVDPELNATAVRYADSVNFADLRWGISTEDLDSETGSRKILSVCLDEIDRCRPYMLIFIGERYGWIPDRSLIKRAADEKRFSPQDCNISVTTLEIEFGALQEAGDLERCIFCFRKPLPFYQMSEATRKIYDAEDEMHRSMMQALKDRIRSTPGARIIEYSAGWDPAEEKVTGLEPLAAQITNEFLSMFSPDWELRGNDAWQQIEAARIESYIEQKTAGLYVRPDMFEEVTGQLDESSAPVMIRGVSGSGKTTIVCQIAERLKDCNNVCTILCGSSERMMDVTDIIRYMIYHVEDMLGKAHSDVAGEVRTFDEYRGDLESLLDEYERTGGRRLLFVLDAMDQLSDPAESAFLMLPEKNYRNVRFIFSALESYEVPLYMENRVRTMHVTPMDDAVKREVIRSILRNERKEVGQAVIEAMIKKPASSNPLYLSLLLRRIVMFNNEDFSEIASLGNDMNAITSYMLRTVDSCPSDLETLCRHISEEGGMRINSVLSDAALGMIAASRFGLREPDIRSIAESEGLAWNPLDFSRLVKYLGPFLIERTDGRIDFSHKSFREGLRDDKHDKSIYDHLIQLPKEDPIRQSEIIYHMYKADAKNTLTDTLWNCTALGGSIERETRELRLLCLEHGPDWLIDVIGTDYSKERGSWFFSFFSTVFCNEFRSTYLEQNCLLQILEAVEKAAEGSGGFQSEQTQGTIEYQIANIYEDTLEDHDAAAEYYKKAYEHLKGSGYYEHDLPTRVNFGIACGAIAAQAAGLNDYATAEKYLREANILFGEAGPLLENDPNILRCLAENELQWTNCMIGANDISAAREHYEKAGAAYDRIVAPDPALREDFDYRRANALMRINVMLENYGEALRILRAQESYVRIEYDRTRSLAARDKLEDILTKLASVSSLAGMETEAVKYIKEAVRNAELIDAEMQTADSARSLIRAEHRAAALIKSFDIGLAASFADKAVERARALLAEYDNTDTRESLGAALRERGQIAEKQEDWDLARKCADESVDMYKADSGEEAEAAQENNILYSEMTILKGLFNNGEFDKAFPMLKECLGRARTQMLDYPGVISLNIYDNFIDMPFTQNNGWDRPEYMEILNGERMATIFMTHDDPLVLAQAEGECRGMCYEMQGMLRFYSGDSIGGLRDMRTAQDVYRKTFDKTGHAFFANKADRIDQMIEISTS